MNPFEQKEGMTIEEMVDAAVAASLNVHPDRIERIKTGLCNEVFAVSSGERELIIRLNSDGSFMKGSEKYIPLFRSKEIQVPEILGSDYSKTTIPYCYQLLSRIEGEDLGNVIEALSEEELSVLAREIVGIFEKLKTIPTDGSFGYVEGQEHAPHTRWADVVEEIFETAVQRGNKTGILSEQFIAQVRSMIDSFSDYIDQAPSTFYYDDIASKNVMISEGRLSGLVDLDGVAFGDPLEAVGRIKTSFHYSEKGKIYIEAIQNEFALDHDARRAVAFYSALHKFAWMCENGIQFNQNTTAVVDEEKLQRDQLELEMLMEEYKNLS